MSSYYLQKVMTQFNVLLEKLAQLRDFVTTFIIKMNVNAYEQTIVNGYLIFRVTYLKKL